MASSPRQIFLISFVALSLELAFIRFIPAEVKAISYFINLLLFSSFFGLGIGCILSRKRPLLFLMPLGAALLFLFMLLARGIMIYDTAGTDHYWLAGMDPQAVPLFKLPIGLSAILIFMLASLPFIVLGQMLAQAMDRLSRLRAYSWDIAGSVCGTLLFSLGSFYGLPPWLWISADLVIFAFLAYSRWRHRLPSLACALAFLYFFCTPFQWAWSPYYLVQFQVKPEKLFIFVNSGFHQMAVNFETTDPLFSDFAKGGRQRYEIPYETYRKYHGGSSPASVLILGAGSGNDAYIAVKNGAKRVVAVEIDPVIIKIGRDYNQLRPYQNPAVTLVEDDGRHYLRSTKETFDLVIFGTLDSQTLLSGQSNLRLENYIYTAECFADVKRVLREGGMVGAYYSVFKPWLTGRLYATMEQAFPGTIRFKSFDDRYLFNLVIMGAKGVPNFQSDPAQRNAFAGHEPLTDDWPFIYLERRTISTLYQEVFTLVGLLVIGAFFLLRKLHGASRQRSAFFFLGMGFTLLEAAAVVRLALLFGAVWMVSAGVFLTALVTIFLANLCVWKKVAPSLRNSWLGLLLLVLANYFVPLQWFLGLGLGLRVLLCFVLLGLPVFFAGVCFSRLFAKETETGFALGINLVGAMIGGLLEYLSMVLGMRAIWLLVALVYLLAFFSSRARSNKC